MSECRVPGTASKADILVVGGGIVGTTIAGFLAEAGMSVIIVDQSDGAGSTSNAGSLHVQMQSRFMRLYPESVPGMEAQLPLYPEAVRFWRELQLKLGADFELSINGGLMVAETADELDFLRAKAARERALGLDVDILDRRDIDRIAPYLAPSIVGAELCADEGKVNPLRANSVLREWSRALGVERISRQTVDAIEWSGGLYTVAAGHGAISVPRVVVAAGWGSGALLQAFGLDIPTVAEPLHIAITEPAEYRIDRLIQHADRMITLKQLASGHVVIGGGWPARQERDCRVPAVELESMIANATLAQHVVPALARLKIIRCWAGNNTAVDGRGVLGAIAGWPGLFVAIPGDAGYTLGPLSAKIVSDLVLDRDPGRDLSLFAPERFRRF